MIRLWVTDYVKMCVYPVHTLIPIIQRCVHECCRPPAAPVEGGEPGTEPRTADAADPEQAAAGPDSTAEQSMRAYDCKYVKFTCDGYQLDWRRFS